MDHKRGKARSRYRNRSDCLPSWQQLLCGLANRRNAGERTAVAHCADLECNVLQFDCKLRTNAEISGRRLGPSKLPRIRLGHCRKDWGLEIVTFVRGSDRRQRSIWPGVSPS
jgi:hypothetical protein